MKIKYVLMDDGKIAMTMEDWEAEMGICFFLGLLIGVVYGCLSAVVWMYEGFLVVLAMWVFILFCGYLTKRYQVSRHQKLIETRNK